MSAELIGRIENRVPLIPLLLPGGRSEAILDTGFDGAVMLPVESYDALPEAVDVAIVVVTALGEEESCLARRAKISWLGRDR